MRIAVVLSRPGQSRSRFARSVHALLAAALLIAGCNAPGDPGYGIEKVEPTATPSSAIDAARAAEKVFDAFARGKASAAELDAALAAAGDLPPASIGTPLLGAFKALRASADHERAQRLGGVLLRHVSPTWLDGLLEVLKTPLLGTRVVSSDADMKLREDQVFWHATAVELLGAVSGSGPVEPLLGVLLDARKQELHALVILSLVRIGMPALERASRLIGDPEDPLARHWKMHEPPDLAPGLTGKSHVVQSAILLAELRFEESREPILRALEHADSDVLRAVLARELTKVPRTPETIATFKRVYEGSELEEVAGQPSLIEAADNLLDPELVPWLLGNVDRIKDPEQAADVDQNPALMTAVRLMTPEQVDLVRPAVRRRDVDLERQAFERAAMLLEQCRRQMSCYLVALTEEKHQTGLGQITAIKAALMLGILGGAEAQTGIIQRYLRIRSPAVRLAATRAIEHLTGPENAAAARDAVAKLVDDLQRGSKKTPVRDLPLEYVRWRLAARARG